jgi:hypothetical protein
VIRIGCSGWSYDHWRGVFYPQSGSSARWLELYAESFDTIEINATFYRLPSAKTIEPISSWTAAALAGSGSEGGGSSVAIRSKRRIICLPFLMVDSRDQGLPAAALAKRADSRRVSMRITCIAELRLGALGCRDMATPSLSRFKI